MGKRKAVERRRCDCGALLPSQPQRLSHEEPTEMHCVYDAVQERVEIRVSGLHLVEDVFFVCRRCGRQYDVVSGWDVSWDK